MNLLDEKIQDFINRQLNTSAAELVLQASKYPDWDMKLLAQQLVGKQLAQKKLPTWFNCNRILYPVRLSMEQCSSEITALYKSSIINSGKGIDLTGGFGVDTYFLALKSEHVTYCERNSALATIVLNNFKELSQDNITIHTGDGIEKLKTSTALDWIFVDPARRKEGARIFKLEDCVPNVIDLHSLFFEKANRVLIKAAPLLDIHQTLIDIDFIKEVHIVSVNNDCKEVLYLLEKDFTKAPKIYCINSKPKAIEQFSFSYEQERETITEYSFPLSYLYEANSSIMKGGAFKSVAAQFKLKKLHKHSHLYTSVELIPSFPGRVFSIKTILNPDKKALAKHVKGKANLACRNFPQKVTVLKKKLKLKDGGEDYLFATTLLDDKPKLLLCKKV